MNGFICCLLDALQSLILLNIHVTDLPTTNRIEGSERIWEHVRGLRISPFTVLQELFSTSQQIDDGDRKDALREFGHNEIWDIEIEQSQSAKSGDN